MNKIIKIIKERKEDFEILEDLLPDKQSLLADMCYQGADNKGIKKYIKERLQYQDGWNDCLKESREKITRRKEFEEMNPSKSNTIQTLLSIAEAEIERLEEKLKDVLPRFVVSETVRWINQGENLTAKDADSIKYLGHYQNLKNSISHWQEVIDELKK